MTKFQCHMLLSRLFDCNRTLSSIISFLLLKLLFKYISKRVEYIIGGNILIGGKSICNYFAFFKRSYNTRCNNMNLRRFIHMAFVVWGRRNRMPNAWGEAAMFGVIILTFILKLFWFLIKSFYLKLQLLNRLITLVLIASLMVQIR